MQQSENSEEIQFKILILGEGTVGKSSLLKRYMENSFDINMARTVGLDFRAKKVVLADQSAIRLQIWDTAGQEKYQSITHNFYKGAQGIILVFDLCQKQTFTLLNQWLQSIDEKAGQQVFRIILANKKDLTEKHEVSEQEVEAYCKEKNVQYFMTSAKTGEKVEDAFIYITTIMNQERVKNLKSGKQDIFTKPDIKSTLMNPKQSEQQKIEKQKKEGGCC